MTDIESALSAMEQRFERRLHERFNAQDVVLKRIETQVTLTNGRVTVLEAKDIKKEAAEAARAQAVKEAADLVAVKAAEALSKKERTLTQWVALISIFGTVAGAMATVAAVVGQYLYHL